MTAVATTPSPESEAVPSYLVQFTDLEGKVVRTERLTAASDDEALALAPTMANGHAIDSGTAQDF